MGRSRGGLTTKIHALVDAEGRPVRIGLSEGQASDCRHAEPLLGELRGDSVLLADRAYDTDAIRARTQAAGAFANIPAKRNRTQSFAFSSFLYRYRNHVERFFNKLKNARGLATRYDKRADNFLAAIKLFSVRIWLKGYESTA
jgi:transposase